MLKLDARGKRVLLLSDMHHPYEHPDLIRFLTELKKQFKPQVVISLGDETDSHAMSFHDSDHELFSAGHELQAAIDGLQRVHALFKHIYVLESNHGSMIYRKAKHHGIPVAHLKPLPELYGTPLWSWHDEIILRTKLGPVYLTHGKSAVPMKLALSMGMSSIQGHHHSEMRINWKRFADDRLIYDMICGCLIDPKSPAFAYGKNSIPKPVIGTAIIHESGIPELVPML